MIDNEGIQSPILLTQIKDSKFAKILYGMTKIFDNNVPHKIGIFF